MKPASIHAFFFSPTGTSKKIAAAVAHGLARAGAEETDGPGPVVTGLADRATSAGPGPADGTPVVVHDLTHGAGEPMTLPADAVAVIAAPVYGGHIPPVALDRMKGLHGEGTPAVIVAVYGNRAFEGAAAQLAAFAAERGFVPVGVGAFVGEHSYSSAQNPIAAGRPDAHDRTEAEAFGAAVRRKLAAETPVPVDAALLRTPRTPLWPMLRFIAFVLRYRRRQRKQPVVAVPAGDQALCTQCGRCAALCPVEAILPGDFLRTDPARCIRCNACVKGCPVGARSYHTPFAAALSRNFRHRKPPVTLL